MSRKSIIGIALVAALAVPVVGWAHGGHAHKVMGTVSSIDGNHLVIKTTDGKIVTVMIDAKTKITKGKTKLAGSALNVGDRVVAEGAQEKEMLTAASLQVGTAPATAGKK